MALERLDIGVAKGGPPSPAARRRLGIACSSSVSRTERPSRRSRAGEFLGIGGPDQRAGMAYLERALDHHLANSAAGQI